jgi:hypothetical protein
MIRKSEKLVLRSIFKFAILILLTWNSVLPQNSVGYSAFLFEQNKCLLSSFIYLYQKYIKLHVYIQKIIDSTSIFFRKIY